MKPIDSLVESVPFDSSKNYLKEFHDNVVSSKEITALKVNFRSLSSALNVLVKEELPGYNNEILYKRALKVLEDASKSLPETFLKKSKAELEDAYNHFRFNEVAKLFYKEKQIESGVDNLFPPL